MLHSGVVQVSQQPTGEGCLACMYYPPVAIVQEQQPTGEVTLHACICTCLAAHQR
jgi:hypothetical protein